MIRIVFDHPADIHFSARPGDVLELEGSLAQRPDAQRIVDARRIDNVSVARVETRRRQTPAPTE